MKTRIKLATSTLLIGMLFIGMTFTGSANPSDGTNENIVDETMIESLIQNMGHQNVSVRVDAVKNLVEIGEPAVDPLIYALKDENPKIQENSASALGKIGDERAVQPLIELLGDESNEVQYAAAIALENLGESAVEPMVEVMNDPNVSWPVRLDVIRILGEMGEPAVEPLIQMLGEEGVVAAASLSNIGEPAVEPLINVLGDDDPHVRAYAARALGGTGDERAVEPVIELLKDEDENVRSNAAMALGNIGDERAIEPLTNALSDKSERVRTLAGSAIERIESQDNYGVIATYGKERDFYTEDERQNWLDELDNVGSSLRGDMQKYIHPDGPVISYGYGYDGYISVTFLEGSEVNDSLMNEIYGIIDQRAVQNGIEDVPVEFEFEGMPREDIEIESIPREDIETLNAPGFMVLSLVMALLVVLKRKQK